MQINVRTIDRERTVFEFSARHFSESPNARIVLVEAEDGFGSVVTSETFSAADRVEPILSHALMCDE